MSVESPREKVRRVMEYIRSDRDRFEVTDERVEMWTKALGWASEEQLLEAATAALSSHKSGFLNVSHIREHLRDNHDQREPQRSWEEVFQIILADCSFSEPFPPLARGDLQAQLDSYRTWRERNPAGVLFPPAHWTAPHLSQEALLKFLDRHARPTIIETIPF